jgi:hypothetical protein
VFSAFGNASVFENNNLIGAHNRTQAMGNNDTCSPMQRLCQRLLD